MIAPVFNYIRSIDTIQYLITLPNKYFTQSIILASLLHQRPLLVANLLINVGYCLIPIMYKVNSYRLLPFLFNFILFNLRLNFSY